MWKAAVNGFAVAIETHEEIYQRHRNNSSIHIAISNQRYGACQTKSKGSFKPHRRGDVKGF